MTLPRPGGGKNLIPDRIDGVKRFLDLCGKRVHDVKLQLDVDTLTRPVALPCGRRKLPDEQGAVPVAILNMKAKTVEEVAQLLAPLAAIPANRRQCIRQQPHLVNQIHYGPLIRIDVFRIAGNLVAGEIIHVPLPGERVLGINAL